MPLTPNQTLELQKLQAEARAEAWAKQASEEGIGTRLSIGAMSAGERMIRALGGRKITEAAGLHPEELEAAKTGAGTAGTIGEIGTDIATLAIPGTRLGTFISGAATKLLPRALGQAIAGGSVSALTTPGGLDERLKAAEYGAAGGAIGEVGGQLLARTAARATEGRQIVKDVQKLVPNATPGQTTYEGSVIRNLEEGTKYLPFAGTKIVKAQKEALGEWNSSILERVRLPQVDTTIPRTPLKSGHEGLKQIQAEFETAYQQAIKSGVEDNILKIEEAYSRFSPIQQTVIKAGRTNPAGIFTPQQLMSELSHSASPKDFAEGLAPLQKEAAEGIKIFGDAVGKEPNYAGLARVLLGGGGVAYGTFGPQGSGTAPLAIGAGSALLFPKTFQALLKAQRGIRAEIPEAITKTNIMPAVGQDIGREAGQPSRLTPAQAMELAKLKGEEEQEWLKNFQ